jgi:hypothetical protein
MSIQPSQISPSLVKVDAQALADAVNLRLTRNYSASYIGSVLAGNKGSAALQDVVSQENARIIRQAAESLAA